MVALASRQYPRHPPPRRVQGRQNLFPRGTLGGVQQGASRPLASGAAEGVEKRIARTGVERFRETSGAVERNRSETDCDCGTSAESEVRLQTQSCLSYLHL